MLKELTIAVAVSLALALSPSLAEEQKLEGAKHEQGIRAEVRGTLHFSSDSGYFIAVKPVEGGRETRVWLRAAEDKELVGKLTELDKKEVVAKGNLAQMPQEFQSRVPPLGIYLQHGFKIERAAAK